MLSLLLSVALARMLGEAGYGVYAYILALVALLTIPAQFGIGSVLLRFCAAYEQEREWGRMNALLRWSNRNVLITSALFAGAAALIVPRFPGPVMQDPTAFWLGLFLFPVVALGDVRAAALRGLRRFVWSQLPEMIIRPVGFLLFIGVVFVIKEHVGLTPSMAVAGYLGASIIAFWCGAGWLRRAVPRSRDSAPAGSERIWRTAMGVLSVSRGGRVVMERVDLIFVGAIAGAEAAGSYRIASLLAALIAFGLSGVNIVVAPYFARLHADGKLHQLRQMLIGSAALALAIGLPAAGAFVFFGENLLTAVYGAEYSAAYLPLVILSLGQLFNVATGPVGTLIVMTGQEKWALLAVGIALSVSIPLYFVATSRYGPSGAAAVSAAGVMVFNTILTIRALRGLRVAQAPEGAA